MAQQHLDRLSPIDAGFLHQEGSSSHMHIGALLVFQGPPPPFDDLLDHIRSRLHLVPRYRQKLATPPLETGRPLWVDDPSFNLEFHVRHTALPAPRTESQLFALVSRIASQQLDRTKPLWELWMVEGLRADGSDGDAPERFAIICKNHHALVDGISGMDLATVLFDLDPVPPPVPADLEPWVAQPEPSAAELAVTSLRDTIGAAAGAVEHGIAAAVRPTRTIAKVLDAFEGIGEIVWALLNPAPQTPLNVEIGPHRRYAAVKQHLADYKTVKNRLGGTVNDVVLTVVAGALADWLHSRGVRTEGLELRALVPVSVRTAGDRGTLGNKLTVMRGPLPVYIDDPVARLEVVREAMDGLKESKQAVGAATLTAVETFAPPTLLAQASRLNFSTRLFNLLVTNVPGPQVPLYLLGRRLEDLLPIAFLPHNHALAIAIMSYNGGIDYGLIGDYDVMSDIDVVATGIDRALAELLEVAHAAAGPGADATHDGARAAAAGAKLAGDGVAGPGGDSLGLREASDAQADKTGDVHVDNADDVSAAKASDVAPAPILPGTRRRTPPGPASEMRAKRVRARMRRTEPPPNEKG
jgi:WS/DGAT/MGAT family acyltransferase